MMESQVVKRWVERGELKNARQDLVELLALRFPAQVPPEMLATIEQQPSLAMLRDWFRHAAVATSLEEFLKVLRR